MLLLLLTLQVLLLLIRRHTTKETFPVLLLDLLSGESALLGLLLLIRTTQLLDLLVASAAHLAHHFGAKVGRADETVGETEELREERQGGAVAFGAAGESDGQFNALAGGGFLDSA